jgi:hypothetical protein
MADLIAEHILTPGLDPAQVLGLNTSLLNTIVWSGPRSHLLFGAAHFAWSLG